MYIESAKFVARLNKERKMRELRLLQQRENMIKKMDKLHEEILEVGLA